MALDDDFDWTCEFCATTLPRFRAIANQQVVQQISGPAEGNHAEKKLPVVTARQAIAAGGNPKEPTVASVDRSENDSGKGPLKHERVQARRAVRRSERQRTRRR